MLHTLHANPIEDGFAAEILTAARLILSDGEHHEVHKLEVAESLLKELAVKHLIEPLGSLAGQCSEQHLRSIFQSVDTFDPARDKVMIGHDKVLRCMTCSVGWMQAQAIYGGPCYTCALCGTYVCDGYGSLMFDAHVVFTVLDMCSSCRAEHSIPVARIESVS